MKKFILLALVLGGVGTGGYYLTTGRLPWVSLSEEEQQISALRADLGRIRQQWAQAGKAATFGMDTGSMVEGPLAQLEQLDKAVSDLTPRLKTAEARNQAQSLRQDIEAFRSKMR
jgi:hypothetical protein